MLQNFKTRVPPIKTQGIKTKLVPFILSNVKIDAETRYVEPFMGSGVVLFNIGMKNALAADLNPYVIDFYKSIQDNSITPDMVKEFLTCEGEKLKKNGASHYYEIRDRFNMDHDPLDFLFLSRSCFNGLMRFNRNKKYNVPFCKKPERFAKAYVTKITNQVRYVKDVIKKNWEFVASDWRKTADDITKDDFIYLDPPYTGRDVNYYGRWERKDLVDLSEFLKKTECRFALSLWYENKYRKNDDVDELFGEFTKHTFEHFYHVGATEDMRNSMKEVLIVN